MFLYFFFCLIVTSAAYGKISPLTSPSDKFNKCKQNCHLCATPVWWSAGFVNTSSISFNKIDSSYWDWPIVPVQAFLICMDGFVKLLEWKQEKCSNILRLFLKMLLTTGCQIVKKLPWKCSIFLRFIYICVSIIAFS